MPVLRSLTIIALVLAVWAVIFLFLPHRHTWPLYVVAPIAFAVGFVGSFIFSAVLELLGWERD